MPARVTMLSPIQSHPWSPWDDLVVYDHAAEAERQRRRTWAWIAAALVLCLTLIVGTAFVVAAMVGAVRSLNEKSSCVAFFGRQPEARLTYPGGTLTRYTATDGQRGIGQPSPHTEATVVVRQAVRLGVDSWYVQWMAQHGWAKLSDAGRAPYAHVWTKGVSDFSEAVTQTSTARSAVGSEPDLTITLSYGIEDPSNWGTCNG